MDEIKADLAANQIIKILGIPDENRRMATLHISNALHLAYAEGNRAGFAQAMEMGGHGTPSKPATPLEAANSMLDTFGDLINPNRK